jgi:hypothetical protein
MGNVGIESQGEGLASGEENKRIFEEDIQSTCKV